jgi:adenylosuccinate synthase
MRPSTSPAKPAKEKAGTAKIGTTGRGIGPAYEDKIARRALRVQDLKYPERFATKLRELLDLHNFVLTGYLHAPAIDFDSSLCRGHAPRRAAQAHDGRRLARAQRRPPRRRQAAV